MFSLSIILLFQIWYISLNINLYFIIYNPMPGILKHFSFSEIAFSNTKDKILCHVSKSQQRSQKQNQKKKKSNKMLIVSLVCHRCWDIYYLLYPSPQKNWVISPNHRQGIIYKWHNGAMGTLALNTNEQRRFLLIPSTSDILQKIKSLNPNSIFSPVNSNTIYLSLLASS